MSESAPSSVAPPSLCGVPFVVAPRIGRGCLSGLYSVQRFSGTVGLTGTVGLRDCAEVEREEEGMGRSKSGLFLLALLQLMLLLVSLLVCFDEDRWPPLLLLLLELPLDRLLCFCGADSVSASPVSALSNASSADILDFFDDL